MPPFYLLLWRQHPTHSDFISCLSNAWTPDGTIKFHLEIFPAHFSHIDDDLFFLSLHLSLFSLEIDWQHKKRKHRQEFLLQYFSNDVQISKWISVIWRQFNFIEALWFARNYSVNKTLDNCAVHKFILAIDPHIFLPHSMRIPQALWLWTLRTLCFNYAWT